MQRERGRESFSGNDHPHGRLFARKTTAWCGFESSPLAGNAVKDFRSRIRQKGGAIRLLPEVRFLSPLPQIVAAENVGFKKRHVGNDLGERARVNPLPQEIDGRRFILYGQPYYRQFLGGEGTDQLAGQRGGLRLPARSLGSLATDRQGSQSPAVLGQRT
jgi:hypothetical protein